MMTSKIGSAVTGRVMQRMAGPEGVNAGLAALSWGGPAAEPVDAAQVRTLNIAAELAERSSTVRYPAMQVYCEKVVNELREKFRTFSGTVHIAVEVRHSQDRMEGLQDRLEMYADAVTQVLHESRGDWGDGIFYGGGYQVTFGPVKIGGRNFIQTAKVSFEVGVSKG